jgi:flagellar FliL protein
MADGKEPGAKGSLVLWLGAMAAMTCVAIGFGGFVGLQLAAAPKKDQGDKVVAEHAPAHHDAAKKNSNMLELPTIVVNLTEPADTWVRIRAAIVFEDKAIAKPEVLAAEIAEDILGFMKTLSVAQIGGPSGLMHLREDLNERAVIRSDGKVRELIIENLVVQ